MTANKKRVRSDVVSAKPAVATPPPGGRPPPAFLSKMFRLDADGLWKKNGDEDKPDLWVCAAFKVTAQTRDGDRKSWGLLLKWIDPDGHAHELLVSRALFSGEGGDLRALLASNGLLMNPRTDARQALIEYLNTVSIDSRAYSVLCCGWHVIEGKRLYVQPDNNIIGSSKHRVILQTISNEPTTCNQAGAQGEWMRSVSVACIGNSRLLVAHCAAYAAPLIDLLGEDGFGIHFHGKAKIGKSLLLISAASVWGGTPSSGAKGYSASWRITVNGLDALAARHTHALAVLDEIGSIPDPRELGDAVYMLGNGIGKARADRTGGMRAAIKYKLVYLSSGESSIADKIAEGGKVMKAGQEVRLIDMKADAGIGQGVYDTVEDYEGPEEASKILYEACKTHYGTAAPMFIRHVLDRMDRDPEFVSDLAKRVDVLTRSWLSAFPAGGGQLSTVARRFAILAIAGEIATEGFVTGWSQGEATRGVHTCFLSWLQARGTMGSREDAQAATQLRNFMSRNQRSRFMDWAEKPVQDAQQTLETTAPIERFRPVIQAGWRRWRAHENKWTYYLSKEAMRTEVLKGLDFSNSIKAFRELGLIVPDSQGKSAVSITPPGCSSDRFYQIAASLNDEDNVDD